MKSWCNKPLNFKSSTSPQHNGPQFLIQKVLYVFSMYQFIKNTWNKRVVLKFNSSGYIIK